jgi:geranylgeranyl pyrophosphate synthase
MTKESLAEKSLLTLNEKSDKARKLVKKIILEEKLSQEKINQAVELYLSRWNDTTRPGTLALSYEAVGGEPDKAVSLQTALLLIDATMDIHDDILDESLAKKNIKTIYGKLGKEAALLIGDALMVKGFSQLHKALENLPQERQALIIDEVHTFLLEVVDAHIIEAQLKAKKWSLKPETYLQVLTKKAADIEGRMKVGAIYGGGSPHEVETLGKFGRNLGILLLIRAEFVDMFERDELTNRVKNECLPLPILYAIQNKTCKRKIRKILLKANKISKYDCDAVVEIIDNSAEVLTLKNYLLEIEKEAIHLLDFINKNQVESELHSIVISSLENLWKT